MELDEWLAQLSAELGTDDVELDHQTVKVLLDLARDAAHGVERVAAPLTTFLVGVAVGRGQSVTARPPARPGCCWPTTGRLT